MKTEAIQDYLKKIYKIQLDHSKVTTSQLAKQLGITPASVTGMIKKLSDLKLVTYERYQGVVLTEGGRKIALEVIRHHRLIELFLAEALDVPWDKVHDEAEKWEHVLSEEMEERIDKLLGYPTHDPHGSPIPTRNGEIEASPSLCLADLETSQHAEVVEVDDNDPELLRYLGKMGLYPQASFQVLDVAPFDGPIKIKIEGEFHTIGRKISSHIFVRKIEKTN